MQLIGVVFEVFLGQVVVDVEFIVLVEIDLVVVIVVVLPVIVIVFVIVIDWLVVVVVVFAGVFEGGVGFYLLLDALLEFN